MTPNVRDKVLWDPTNNAWKLLLVEKNKPKRASFIDDQGVTLKVPERLTAAEHEIEKKSAYARATRAWNALDASGRWRIPLHLSIQLKPLSSASGSDSQEIECANSAGNLSLQSKWEQDASSLKL